MTIEARRIEDAEVFVRSALQRFGQKADPLTIRLVAIKIAKQFRFLDRAKSASPPTGPFKKMEGRT